MPSLTLSFTPSGPLVRGIVAASAAFGEQHLATGGGTLPTTTATLLLDTGAAITAIDTELIEALRLVPTGSIAIITPSTGRHPVECLQYDISLTILGGRDGDPPLFVPVMPVVVTELRQQGIDGLVGRDVLDHCLLFYNGPIGTLTLAY